MHQNEIRILSIDVMFWKCRAPSGSLSSSGRTTGADRLNYWLKISYICDEFVIKLSKNAVIQYLTASRSGSRSRKRTKSHFQYKTTKENKQKIAELLIPAHFEVRFSMKLLKFHVKIKREFYNFLKKFFFEKNFLFAFSLLKLLAVSKFFFFLVCT